MLDAKTNRLDYGEQLIPPDSSYELDFAVGTTFSLDMEAIMVLPVAMFYSRRLDCSLNDLHFDVLDAITQSADKIRVYCQKGKIKVPKKYNRLMSYWEKGIVEIRMDSEFSSFHPKVWVVRFTKGGHASFYRLLITSRNLTYAHDWDIAFSTEGEVGNELIGKNKPLVQFLQYLQNKGGEPYPEGFIEDLGKVNFNFPDDYNLMDFHPIGIQIPANENNFPNPLLKRSWEDLLIVSPFIDNKTFRSFVDQTAGRLTILSRKEELDKIDADLISKLAKNSVFQFSEFIKDAENQEGICDGNPLEALPQNLHAKIFIGSKNGYIHWYMGSANCTQPAFVGRNVEFLVELKSEQAKLSPPQIAKSLTASLNGTLSLFEVYQIEKRQDETGEESLDGYLRKIIFDLTGLVFKGDLSLRDSGEHRLYDLNIQCDASSFTVQNDFEIRVKPVAETSAIARVLMPGNMNRIVDFRGYNELQLSPYLEIYIIYKGSTVKSFIAEMQIDLPETRMDAIFRSIIDDKEKFLKYLSFLLGRTTPERITTQNHHQDKNSGSSSVYETSLYENLLEAASRKPEKLRSVKKIVQRLQNSNSDASTILTEDFLQLWHVFDKFMNRVEK